MQEYSRDNIADAIARELLDNGILDENNFSHDTGSLLSCVQKIILEHLKDYSLLSGKVF